ncbi:hypothetical protein SCB71_18805 [Herbiconiux sp. KACC 21604]|uniref:hypothetical protein n=1 Tax=unclassified Herbiconiux TaxID=2618217 RepID=UPI001490EC9E|nr:hypothetical protein [Herbiconiux sp. SALV-R1]QJU55100.1 hypothetical protein HL652_16745 [Herbiconiux sp. SALV-R1]WPO86247.1 hypothetical protein SCB71_18805 [Herbiconiux sp. KACC 21604]
MSSRYTFPDAPAPTPKVRVSMPVAAGMATPDAAGLPFTQMLARLPVVSVVTRTWYQRLGLQS